MKAKTQQPVSVFAILQLIKLCRLYYGIPLAAGYLVIVTYLNGGTLAGLADKAAFAYFALLATISAGYICNDICDIAVDQINAPNRPLANGRISSYPAKIIASGLVTCSIGLATLCNWRFATLITIINITLLFYNRYSKRLALAKNIIVAGLLASLYPLAFSLTDPVDSPRLTVLYIHPIWLFLTVLGYEMFKDLRDAKGDIALGGPNRKISQNRYFLTWAKVLILAGAGITLLPVLMNITGPIYLTSSLIAITLAVTATATANKNIFIAINCIYIQIAIITAGSLLDIL